MTGFLAHIRFAALALAVVFLIGVAAPAIAQTDRRIRQSDRELR